MDRAKKQPQVRMYSINHFLMLWDWCLMVTNNSGTFFQVDIFYFSLKMVVKKVFLQSDKYELNFKPFENCAKYFSHFSSPNFKRSFSSDCRFDTSLKPFFGSHFIIICTIEMCNSKKDFFFNGKVFCLRRHTEDMLTLKRLWHEWSFRNRKCLLTQKKNFIPFPYIRGKGLVFWVNKKKSVRLKIPSSWTDVWEKANS